jgi:hypothetical protein
MSSFLTKEQIMQAQDLKTETVHIPEWGGDVQVRTITAKERDDFEKQLISGDQTDLENIRAKFVAATVVDENGKLMFTKLDLVDLGKKSASAMDKLFEVGQKLAGLKKEEVEEMVKN